MLIDLIWILETRFDPYFVVGQTSIRGIAHWTMNVIETHTHSPRIMFSDRFAFYLRSEMNQYHFSYFIFFKPYWMDSGNIQRRNEFGRCKQFLLKFWRQMSPTISIFSLVKKTVLQKSFYTQAAYRRGNKINSWRYLWRQENALCRAIIDFYLSWICSETALLFHENSKFDKNFNKTSSGRAVKCYCQLPAYTHTMK